MLINEIFTPQLQGDWHISGDQAEYSFRVGEASYTIHASQLTVGYEDPDYNNLGELANYNFDLTGIHDVWAVEFGSNDGGGPGDRFGVTGAGNAGQVFGNVIGALQEFVKHEAAGAALFFTAKEASRQNLYNSMVRRLGGKVQVQESKYARGNRGYLIA